ncbi:MAG: trypsin-like serine protease [Actinobacteria bacterium]|nr:trypsin-like serine protease [Actinomycetota bacterium]
MKRVGGPFQILAALAATVLLVAPGASAARSGATGAGGVVTGTFATSAAAALSHWTPQRRRSAVPLELPVLAGGSGPAGPAAGANATEEPGAGGAAATPSYVPATAPDEAAAGLRRGALVTTAAVEGVDTGSSTVYPNSANGVVLGEYVVGATREAYRCSGSVVSSSAGNVVLTAGHCVVDPETGATASYLVFIPGYREGAQPYGQWAATEYATTERWALSAGTGKADEAGDVAMLKLASNGGASAQSTVGALGIAFNQPREATYTQYGYPAAKPYDGSRLYSHTTAYAGADPSFMPPPMRLASDFTGGASGGPWTVSSAATPVALSVTDYGYESQPGYLYGPYFGSLVQHLYEVAAAPVAAPAPVAEPAPSAASPPPPTAPWLRLLRIRRDRGSGAASLRVAVSGAGLLRLSGAGIRDVARRASEATTLALVVRARGRAASELREAGSVAVGVRLTFHAAADGTVSRSRLLRLVAARPR